jgi:hypothetical protein
VDSHGKFEELAKIGYNAYGDAAGWKNHIGRPMPKWEDLPPAIRSYWQVATAAIVENSHSALWHSSR